MLSNSLTITIFSLRASCKYTLTLVPLNMHSHMVWPRESSITNVTLKRFQPRMFPLMPGQLIWPGKLPATLRPGAAEWFLSSVRTHVGLYGIWFLNRCSKVRTSLPLNVTILCTFCYNQNVDSSSCFFCLLKMRFELHLNSQNLK